MLIFIQGTDSIEYGQHANLKMAMDGIFTQ